MINLNQETQIERDYCVYIHKNKINGKKYVGQTCQEPEKRWKNGKGYHNNIYFTRAIKKYGWDNFEQEIVKDSLSKEEADILEKSLIKELNTLNPNGYNAKDGGSNGRPSDITKMKLSESHKGYVMSEETKKKIGESSKGRKHSKETKRKISEANKGHSISEETKRKIAESKKGNAFHKGHKHSKEAKEKMSEKVVQYTKKRKLIKIWDSMTDAANNLGINVSNISACCNGRRRKAGGFIWDYYE